MLTQYRPHSSANLERAEFAKKLVKILRQKGMNQSELARAMGFSRDAVSSWVRARSMPEPKNLIMLADVLGTTVEELTLPIEHDPTRSQLPLLMGEDRPPDTQELVNLQIDVETNRAKLIINANLPVDKAMAIVQAYRRIAKDETSD